jgi:hypothetical protein
MLYSNKQMAAIETIKKSFSTTLGIVAGVILSLLILAVLAYGFAWTHDYAISRSYDSHPSLSKDNKWGPLLISVTITEQNRTAPVAAHAASCYESPFFRGYSGAGGLKDSLQSSSDPNCTYTVPAAAGSNTMSGTVRIKNRLWLRSVRVSSDLIKAQFDTSTRILATSTPGLDGKVLNPGQGLSNKFEATFGGDNDGAVVLSHGSKNYVLH